MSVDPIFGDTLNLDAAVMAGLDPIGTCDWGGCDRLTWGMRWCPDEERYLSVCWVHSQGP